MLVTSVKREGVQKGRVQSILLQLLVLYLDCCWSTVGRGSCVCCFVSRQGRCCSSGHSLLRLHGGSGCKRQRSMALLAAISSYGDDTDSSAEDTLEVDRGATIAGAAVEPTSKKQRLTSALPTGEGTEKTSSQHPARQVSSEGRVRSFPHIEGNYAGYVYIPMRRIEGLEAAAVRATNMVAAILNKNWKHGKSRSNQHLLHRIPVQDLHLSVSRTFALRRQQIEPVVELLRKNLNALPRFDAAVSGIDLYSNDEKTRSFVGLSLCLGATRMETTTRAVDHALSTCSLEPFYKEMRFHVSVAWFAGALPDGVPSMLSSSDIRKEEGSGGCDDGRDDVGQGPSEGGGKDEGFEKKEEDALVPRVDFPVHALEAKIGAKKYVFKLKHG
mmetsp:Transcript_99563/g.145517  ORF Transcript_99563/g.145517 Transcript_99563/m.145517 type:complete len:385 (+) Transcript_99563:288-1442(+)